MACLCYLCCVCCYGDVKHILCWVGFFHLVCPVLLVLLDCQFLVAPSVFSNVCLIYIYMIDIDDNIQYLCIVEAYR
jgi:hypothetical protein